MNINSLVEETVSTLGFKLVEVRIIPGKSGRILKVVIHKDNGDVSMKDCASVSNVLLRRLELDLKSFSESYDLIVESPGADRKISSLKELEIFLGREMMFTLKNPASHGLMERQFSGKVEEISGTSIRIGHGEGEIQLDWNDIAGVKLYFNIKDYL
jgi:ribosome maturation factor RimP